MTIVEWAAVQQLSLSNGSATDINETIARHEEDATMEYIMQYQ
jgi:hypothetical protein